MELARRLRAIEREVEVIAGLLGLPVGSFERELASLVEAIDRSSLRTALGLREAA
jgi:TPP-dependent indolepyruvate ferredoxin oxidoreductase alpha subunit